MTRILVKDLEPGRLHYIQARVNNLSEVSPWSSLHEFTTISDTLAPAACTGLTWTVEGTAFKAVWTGPTTNSDGTPLMDFKDFQIKLYSSAAPSTIATYYTTAARFDFSFESNLNAFGTPRASVTIEVRARDNSGNLSDLVTATATNPAPANVTGLTAVGISDAVALRWNANSDKDLKYYQVRQGTALGAETNLVYTGQATSFVFDTTATVAQYFAVVAVDVFGSTSATPAQANAIPRSTMGVDSIPPATPTNVTVGSFLHGDDATKSSAFIDVNWTGVTDSDLQNYSVRYASSLSSGWQYIDVPEGVTTTRIQNLKTNSPFYISVAAVDYSGNSSAYVDAATYPIYTAKDTAAPVAVTDVAIAAGVTTATVTWTENSEGDVKAGIGYYEVQLDIVDTFDSTDLKDKQVTGTVVSFSGLVSGTTYYTRVRAIDGAGNQGAWSTIISAAPRNVENADIAVGSLSGDKITAASLNGDRVIANTLDAASIKANTAFVSDLLIQSKFTIDASGVMQSSDYASGVSGWQFANNTLEINDGTISAKALNLQNGSNMLHPAYADFEYQPTWYTDEIILGGGQGTWEIVTAPDVTARFNTQAFKLNWPGGNNTYSRVIFGRNSTDYNVEVESNSEYIYSAYMMTPAGSGAKTVNLAPKMDTGVYHTQPDQSLSDDGEWHRFSYVFGTDSSMAIMPTICTNVAGDLYIDGLQLEKKLTAKTEPSQWKPPSFTSIDGGIIRTGEIRSTASANGLSGQPAWSINMQGAAQFGDATVRGRLVVGDPNNIGTDGINSRIYSANYVSGTEGWIIRSDGYAEFRNLAVNSVKVTALDSPFQNTSYAKLYDYMQDGTLWLQNGEVVQKTDPSAFSANSLFEFTGPGLICRNGTGVNPIAFDPTILYRVSARVRAYSVSTLNSNSTFETDTSGWTAYASTAIAQDATKFFAGAASMKISSNDAAATTNYGVSTDIDVSPEHTYTFGSRVLPNSADVRDNIRVNIIWKDSTGTTLSTDTIVPAAPVDANGAPLPVDGTTWFSVNAVGTAPANAATATFEIEFGIAAQPYPLGDLAWIDDVTITTPPRIKLGVFGTDMDGSIIDYDYVDDVNTPDKKHAFPDAASVGILSTYASGQYMVVADNDEIPTAVADSTTITDWITITGYLRGRGGSGTDGAFGTPSKAPDPYKPGSVNTDVSYLLPYVEFDVAPGTKAQVDQFSLEAFEGGAPGKVATATGTTQKAVTIENLTDDSGFGFDHAIRFYSGDEDEISPGIVAHTMDGGMNDAAHIRIAPPLINRNSTYGTTYIGVWDRNPNYVYDATFLNGINGWLTVGQGSGSLETSLSWNTDEGRTDTSSLKLTAAAELPSGGGKWYNACWDVPTDGNPEMFGRVIGASAYLKGDGAGPLTGRVQINFLDSNYQLLEGWYTENTLDGTDWQRYSFVTGDGVPDDTYVVRIWFGWSETGIGRYILADDIQMELDEITDFRAGSASRIALNTDIIRSRGSLIISGSDINLPPNIIGSNGRPDVPEYEGLIVQTSSGTGSIRLVNYTDADGDRASWSSSFFGPDGTEESAIRIYGLNDAKFPGTVAVDSPGGWALTTEPKNGDTSARYNTHVYGSLTVDGDLDWKVPTSIVGMTPYDNNRAVAYAKFAGMVFLRGSGSLTTTKGVDMFTLPVGYRPPANYYLNAGVWDGTNNLTATAIIRVGSDGVVRYYCETGGGPVSDSASLTLDGLFFPINAAPVPQSTGTDTTAPGSPTGFSISAQSASSSTGTYRLSWTNPSASDLAGVKIIWRSDRYPTVSINSGTGTKTMTTDGKVITIGGSSGQSKSYDHSGLPANKTIYYRVVAFDKSGNHSSYVSASRYLLASPVHIYADSSDSYRLGYGGMWRNDGDDVYQGDWTGNDNHRGLFFYGTKIYDALSKGGVVRKPTKMTVYLSRTGSGGNYSGVGINLRGHKYQVKPSGDPIGGMTNEGSDGDNIVYLSPGEHATVTVPSSWYNNFVVDDPNNTDRLEGLGVYGSSSSDYAVMYGRSHSSAHGKITIYHRG